MDFYGRTPGGNGLQSGQPPEWRPGGAGADTGLEESVLRLGLANSEMYPERPGVPDCAYYMRTGFCGFGGRCRYNHPRDRAAVAAAVRATGDYPERPGEPACQYYLKTGTCKFDASCKFHHPKHGVGSFSQVPLNISGYPLRPGEKECSFYLKTGQCKFGMTCKFHHPQPAGMSPASAPQFYPSVQSPSVHIPEQYGVSSNLARPPLLHTSYVPPGGYGAVLYPSGVVPVPGWNPYSASVSSILSPGAHSAVGATSLYGVANLPSSTATVGGSYTSLSSSAGPSSTGQREHIFPERPGEPECKYYMKTGDCKFGSSCRYHHPRDRGVPKANCALNHLGLPVRPGIQPCTFYLQNGHCKFGAACRYDHPTGTTRYSPSASSSIDMPVATYPVRSLLATLAPQPYSQELRISSVNTSSHSVGLVFSQTGSIISAPLGSGRSTRQGAEIHHSS